MKPPSWTSEAEMLGAFLDGARAAGWEVYPETAGFDAVLVATEQLAAAHTHYQVGDQVAVEAKLRPSIKVLEQALPPDVRGGCRDECPSADFYVIVVPHRGGVYALQTVARALGINVVSANPRRPDDDDDDRNAFELTFGRFRVPHTRWRRHLRDGPRLWTPPAPVDVEAGVPSPSSVTPWKVEAVRLCLELQGQAITTRAFAKRGLSHRTFLERGWLETTGRDGRHQLYRLTDAADRPDRKYPEVTESLLGSGVVQAIEATPLFAAPLTERPAGLEPQRPAQLKLLESTR